MTTLSIECELEYSATDFADYIFNIEAAFHPGQQIITEKLHFEPCDLITSGLDPTGRNRLAKITNGPGKLLVQYTAQVQVNYPLPHGDEEEMSIAQLPVDIIPYIWSSRYCESDSVLQLATEIFGNMPRGYQRVVAICQWIRQNIEYRIGSTVGTMSARDVLEGKAGVCRDFAHLGITFCRALNIPARFVTGYAWYTDPPPDFHAIFEAYLGGRWILFDATELSPVTDIVRIATGKDAAETAFSTIFGPVVMTRMSPNMRVLEEQAPLAPVPQSPGVTASVAVSN
ncbi:MAG: transglutaminase family protein [Verrucomicrobiaceae bacterium]|nr:transglutaminase family protein [Verrucomicrobiaceae bacterium]